MDEGNSRISLGSGLKYLVSGFALAAGLWKLADLAKAELLGGMYAGLKPWVYTYYHPREGALLNYLFLSVGLAAAGLAAYILSPKLSAAKPAVPAVHGKALRWTAGCAIILLFAVVSVEPLRLIIGPVPIFNEYPELFSTTVLDSGPVNNEKFLADARGLALAVGEKLSAGGRYAAFPGLEEEALKALANDVAKAGSVPDTRTLARFQVFVRSNLTEYLHQVMGRGQINHIGHILSPINEYSLGKPATDIYMQYGVGNTLLFKKTMEILGGVSIDNYYKCYLYYLLYYAVFLAMLVYVFRDPIYALCGFSALVFTHFSYNYIAFLMAPGIIPTIHLFDAAVILLLSSFFRRGTPLLYIAASGLLVGCAIFFNRQFGGMLAVAWIATLTVYSFENRSGFRRAGYLLAPPLIAALAFWLSGGMAPAGSAGMLKSYFSGFFSWPPNPVIVFLNVFYLVCSYLFLLFIRQSRSAEKYLYLFTFIYTQGLFVYFYWSGLINHLPIVFPFIALQIFFAARLLERGEVGALSITGEAASRLKMIGGVASLLLAAVSAFYFYYSSAGQKRFWSDFNAHKTYVWGFDRARVVSTIDPKKLEGALALIRKYSAGSGLVLISKYDNILPFLSGRYSLMPHFEMPWYIISEEKAQESAARLKALKPEYLFADTDINSGAQDPWALVYSDALVNSERVAREGRLSELRKLFNAESRNYELLEAGALISVYKRVSKKP